VLQFPGVRIAGFNSQSYASPLVSEARTEISELREWPSIRGLVALAVAMAKWHAFAYLFAPTKVLLQIG
jgi:hypothetical protein